MRKSIFKTTDYYYSSSGAILQVLFCAVTFAFDLWWRQNAIQEIYDEALRWMGEASMETEDPATIAPGGHYAKPYPETGTRCRLDLTCRK